MKILTEKAYNNLVKDIKKELSISHTMEKAELLKDILEEKNMLLHKQVKSIYSELDILENNTWDKNCIDRIRDLIKKLGDIYVRNRG